MFCILFCYSCYKVLFYYRTFLINKAIESTDQSIKTIHENMPIDIVAIYLKEILENILAITGENVTEDIINDIFSKFCLGK